MINDVQNQECISIEILITLYSVLKSLLSTITHTLDTEIVGLTFVNNNEWMEPQRKNSKASAHPDFLVSNSHSH